ncbi:acyl-CoA N-acyltransferase [Mycena leptocephala]|nr:acyl-CoA N-acyltransferase [Mycena leptocephala]
MVSSKRADGGGKFIVRRFQPKDAPQVHALLVEGLVYGPDSPRNTALRRNLNSGVSCATYAGFVLGLGCICSCRSSFFQLVGIALCIVSLALFLFVRRSITNMFLDVCATARTTDLADIAAFYTVPQPADRAQIASKHGPSGFWVAVLASAGHPSSQVVGFLGLGMSHIIYKSRINPTSSPPADCQKDAASSSGELRRMFVSMNHRRRGIGSQLISVALDHVRRLSPPLETLELETSELQLVAQRLYEKHGFRLVGTRVMRMGVLSSLTMLRFRRTSVE